MTNTKQKTKSKAITCKRSQKKFRYRRDCAGDTGNKKKFSREAQKGNNKHEIKQGFMAMEDQI